MRAIRIPRRLLHTASAAGLAVSVGACSDTLSPPTAAPLPAASEERVSAVDENEFNYAARFRVRGSVHGNLRPGGTIQVSATIAANFATHDAELRILAPEPALLRAGRYRGQARLTGLTVAPEVSARATFGGPGEARALGATLTISEPGYYRVLVAALAPNDAPASEDGATMIQNAVYDEVWFTVTPEGGRVTGTYDPTVFAPGTAQQPGPFRSESAAGTSTNTGESERVAMMVDPMTLQLSYFNRDASAWQPLADARYRLVVTGGGTATYNGQTNANGEFTFPCHTAPGSVGTLDVWYESPGKISVIRHATVGTLAWHGGIAVNICGGYTSAAVDQSLQRNAAARVFTNALITVNTSRTLFPTRAGISYKMSTNVTVDDLDTYYSRSDDRIQIDTASTWGAFGIFSVAHEYGHALHHTALGGLKDDSGTCETHSFFGYYNYGCAYKEASRTTTPQWSAGPRVNSFRS